MRDNPRSGAKTRIVGMRTSSLTTSYALMASSSWRISDSRNFKSAIVTRFLNHSSKEVLKHMVNLFVLPQCALLTGTRSSRARLCLIQARRAQDILTNNRHLVFWLCSFYQRDMGRSRNSRCPSIRGTTRKSNPRT